MADDNITESEAQEIIRQFGENKSNLHSFFTKIIQNKDTSKTGNLTQEELGMPYLPVRTYKELSLFCKDVANQDYFGNYFDKMAEIQTATSLSKDALLVKLAATIRKELADVTPVRKKNKSWFKSKDDKGDSQS